MNKTYITIVILVLVVVGGLSFVLSGKKLEAPVVDKNNNVSDVINNTIPVLDSSDTNDMIVKDETNKTKEFIISGQNFSFSPSLITVKKGDKVKITFKNIQGFHDFVIDEYGVATKQLGAPYQEVLEFTADKIGSFEYYCSVGTHRQMGMKGTLKVE